MYVATKLSTLISLAPDVGKLSLMLRSFSLVERDVQVPDRVGHRAVPDVVVENKILRPLPGVEPNFVF
jgi:hypothetical protein